jgi:hypothetical protein
MRKDDIDKGRISEHSRGLGTVTREMVLKRASEIAIINGRSAGQIMDSDFKQAQRELTGGQEVLEEQEAPRRRSQDEARETVRGTHGRHEPAVAAHDEQAVTEKLVQQGVSDAEHDQMVEGTRESIRREK